MTHASRELVPAELAARLHDTIWSALGGAPAGGVRFTGAGALPSVFAVTDLAAASVAAVGSGVAELIETAGHARPAVSVDRRLASLWFGSSIRPIGWEVPPAWDPVAGDYPTRDGWIRLHTNAPHHRKAALAVLGVAPERDAVAAAVAAWSADELETAVVAAGGCAAAMRDLAVWSRHEQGRAVAAEPLVAQATHEAGAPASWPVDPARPLAGIRVLDLTRVLAGPVASRTLAAFGATVLRIDPPDWDEPGVLPDVTPGKARARLDVKTADGARRLGELIAGADVLVHGYRGGALERLGFDAERLRRLNPGLVDVALDAYGWTGPWARRRGFDSLVQMSSGIAAEGMRVYGTDRPKPLPVQALDHATGFIMAAAALRGLTLRLKAGLGSTWRASLARTAALLVDHRPDMAQEGLAPAGEGDFSEIVEATGWGPALRLRQPLEVAGAAMVWGRGAGPLGTDQPEWPV